MPLNDDKENIAVSVYPHAESWEQSDGAAWLAQQLDGPLTLVWTDNRSSMIGLRGNETCGYRLRLHHMFQHAPFPIWQALATFIRAPNAAARQTLRAYIQRHQRRIRSSPPSPTLPRPLRPQGDHFDLAVIFGVLNHTYFANGIQACITWTRRPPQRPRVSIRFGSYHPQQRLIRIHCLLDQDFVPLYVVESVVFHEMLHQLIPRQCVSGRWLAHPPAFRQYEQQFPHYWRAKQWKQTHLMRLLQG